MTVNKNRVGREEGMRPTPPGEYFKRGVQVSCAYTINRPRGEIFRFWRNFENLPRFMTHLKEVRVTDGTHSHWKAKAALGRTIEWDAEIIHEEAERMIAWRSMEGSDIPNAGSVHFVDSDGGATEVRVVLDYIPPAGTLSVMVARLFGETPEEQIQEDLRRFKELMEGEESGTGAVGGGGVQGDEGER